MAVDASSALNRPARPAQWAPERTSVGARAPAGRVDHLDGLRALAAMWVVLSHVWILHHGLFAHRGWIGVATNWTLYSHLAVDVFIVLSGYCLALPVVRKGGLEGGAFAFFGRRARRILPPYYAALALAVVISVVLDHAASGLWRLNLRSLAANVFLCQDAFLKRDIFDGPLWSIAVEWRIYFLLPLLAWVLLHRGRLAVLGLAGVTAALLTGWVLGLRPDFLMTSPWYLFLFALGICAARSASNGAGGRAWAVVAGVGGVGLVWGLWAHPITPTDDTDFGRWMPVVDLFVAVLAAAVLVRLGRASSGLSARILGSRPLTGLGRFSYSVYLIHLPLLRAFDALVGAVLPAATGAERSWVLLLVGVPVALALSYLFFLAVERPFMTARRPAATKPLMKQADPASLGSVAQSAD